MPRVLTETDVADFRERLCAAAERIFVEQGLEAVTMRQLAGELGISPMTPYRYFEDKGEIIAAVRAKAFSRFAHVLEAATADIEDPLAKLEALGQAYIDFALENPSTYKLMFDLNQPDGCAYSDLAEAAGRAEAVVDNILVGLGATPDPENSRRMGAMFWAAAHGPVALELSGNFPPGLVRSVHRGMIEAVALSIRPRPA